MMIFPPPMDGYMSSRADALPTAMMGAPPREYGSARSVPSHMPMQMPRHHGERRRSNLTPAEEDVSRTISNIVRHKAFKRNIGVRPDGYMRLSEVCKEVNIPEEVAEDVARRSEGHGRPRFEMQVDEGEMWIRATSKVSMRDGKGQPIVSQHGGAAIQTATDRDRGMALQDDKALISKLQSDNRALEEKVALLEAHVVQLQRAAAAPGFRQPPPPSEPDQETREVLQQVDAVQTAQTGASLLGPALLFRPSSSSTLQSTASGGPSTSSPPPPPPPRPPLPPDEMPGAALQVSGSGSNSRSSSTSGSSLRQAQLQPQEPVPQPQEPVPQPQEPVPQPQEPVPQPQEPVLQPQEPVLQPPEQAPEAPPSDSPKYLVGYRVVAPHVAQDESEVGLSVGEPLDWCIPTEYAGWLYIQKLSGVRGYVPEQCLQPPEAARDVEEV